MCFNKNKIGEIIYGIECALENMDIDYMNETEKEINLLSHNHTDDADISVLIDFFMESKQEIIKQMRFDETKKIMKDSYISCGMDEATAEEEADNFAWRELLKNNCWQAGISMI